MGSRLCWASPDQNPGSGPGKGSQVDLLVSTQRRRYQHWQQKVVSTNAAGIMKAALLYITAQPKMARVVVKAHPSIYTEGEGELAFVQNWANNCHWNVWQFLHFTPLDTREPFTSLHGTSTEFGTNSNSTLVWIEKAIKQQRWHRPEKQQGWCQQDWTRPLFSTSQCGLKWQKLLLPGGGGAGSRAGSGGRVRLVMLEGARREHCECCRLESV